MPRADLLLNLVKYGIDNNKPMFRKVAEAIIAEERSKKHNILADRMDDELNKEFTSTTNGVSTTIKQMAENRIENFVYELTPKKKFDDLILPKGINELCKKIVEEQHRVDVLRSYSLEPRNRILLIGPPGNGKTSLAEAIAESLIVPLYVVKYDSIIGTYLGETAVRLRKLIEFVCSRRCVLFFDEFETIGKERGDIHETGEIKRVVSSLLLHIDSLPSHVVVIAATNHPELLDRAAWRRFQVRVNLPMPIRSNLEEWFLKFQKTHNLKFGYSDTVLAKKFIGYSYAEVEEFAISVLRNYVLSIPNAKIKDLVTLELKNWNLRSVKSNRKKK